MLAVLAVLLALAVLAVLGVLVVLAVLVDRASLGRVVQDEYNRRPTRPGQPNIKGEI